MTDRLELWEDPPGEWLGGYLHPGWAAGWRRSVAAVQWVTRRVSWALVGVMLAGGVAALLGVRLAQSRGFVQSLPVVLSVASAIGGTIGLMFGALRFSRDEAAAVIGQQQSLLVDMKRHNDEICERLARVDSGVDAMAEKLRTPRG